MENKKLLFAASILATAMAVFFTGTIIYFAVDVFALYSENQFTGRMRSFDVEYWNAVGGAAVIFVPFRIVSWLAAQMKNKNDELEAQRMVDTYSRLADEFPGVFDDKTIQESTPISKFWDPPKNPPFFN